MTRGLELEPELGFFLGAFYVDMGGGVWLRAVTSKKLLSLTKKSRDGFCRLSSSDLRSLAAEALGADVTHAQLTKIDSSGSVIIERADVSLGAEAGLEWKCRDEAFALTKIHPRNLSLKMDLRYTFGFDTNY